MTVTDISLKLRTNRNSIAKYLDILLILGHVQMLTFGPAKVYFPSKRIPLRSILNFTSDCLILIDENLTIININNNLLTTLGIKKEKIIGQHIKNIDLPPFNNQEVQTHLKKALNGEQTESQITLINNDKISILNINHIPTTFDDSTPGVACIITDVTELIATKQQLEYQKLENNAISNIITDLLIVIDTDFTIKQINQAVINFFNLPKQQILGKKWMNGLSSRSSVVLVFVLFSHRKVRSRHRFHRRKVRSRHRFHRRKARSRHRFHRRKAMWRQYY